MSPADRKTREDPRTGTHKYFPRVFEGGEATQVGRPEDRSRVQAYFSSVENAIVGTTFNPYHG